MVRLFVNIVISHCKYNICFIIQQILCNKNSTIIYNKTNQIQMYIKIFVYIIDNQQVKSKINILFFGLLVVCRSYLPPFVDWGGGPKNGSPAGVISGRWSVPHIPHTSICDAHPNISLISPCPHQTHPSSPHDLLINFIIFAI